MIVVSIFFSIIPIKMETTVGIAAKIRHPCSVFYRRSELRAACTSRGQHPTGFLAGASIRAGLCNRKSMSHGLSTSKTAEFRNSRVELHPRRAEASLLLGDRHPESAGRSQAFPQVWNTSSLVFALPKMLTSCTPGLRKKQQRAFTKGISLLRSFLFCTSRLHR